MKSIPRLIFVVGLILLVGSAPLLASRTDKDKKKNSNPSESGEVLVYTVELSKAVLRGMNVGEIRFTAEKANEKDGDSRELRYASDVSSQGFFVKLFGLHYHQTIETRVDAKSRSLVANEKVDEQGKRKRESTTVVDSEKGKLTFNERDPNSPDNAPRVVVADFNGMVFDLTSAIYYLRTRELKTGDNLELTVSDNGKVSRIPFTVFERKRLNSALGKTQTIRVEAGIFGPDRLLNGTGSISIWMTDDARHIPVKAHLTTSRGEVDIKLKSISQATAK